MTRLIPMLILGKVLGLDEWHLPICYQNPPFPGKMPVPSQECVVFQLFRRLKTQMVELLIGFVCFCGLSLLDAPWSTVPLLLPLFGSVPTDLA